jgi:hypothetical protein
MRRLLAPLVFVAAAASPTRAQVRDVPTSDTLGANFRHDSVGTATPTDFDFLDGKWNIRFQSRSSPTAFGPARAGTWSAHRTHDGLLIEDEFSLINADGSRTLTMTYRVYNKARKTWEIAGTGAKQGTPWATGVCWSDGRDRYVVQTYGAGPDALITRIRYYAITKDHFLWRADGSTDGGKTWTRDFWKIEADRAK